MSTGKSDQLVVVDVVVGKGDESFTPAAIVPSQTTTKEAERAANVEHTLEILVDKVGHVVPFDTCIVYFYDDQKGYATARHVAG